MYDVAVIGGGPAGGSSAIFLAKAGMKTIVLDNDRGQTRGAWLANHYGFADGVSGPDLVEGGRRQACSLGADWATCQVSDVQRSGSGFTVSAENGETYEARQVVLATGAALALAEKMGLTMTAGREERYPKVVQVDIDGRTSQPGVWACGIIAGCSAHTIITCGHGAQVAIGLLSESVGKRVVQHDVLQRVNRPAEQRSGVNLQQHVDSDKHTNPDAQNQLREAMETQHQMQGGNDMRSRQEKGSQDHMNQQQGVRGNMPPERNMQSPDYMQSQNDMTHHNHPEDYMPSQNDSQNSMGGQMGSQKQMDPQERIRSQSHMQSENPIEDQTPEPTVDMRSPYGDQPEGRMQPQMPNESQDKLMPNEARHQREMEQARELARQAEERQERNDMRGKVPPQMRDHQGSDRQPNLDRNQNQNQQNPRHH